MVHYKTTFYILTLGTAILFGCNSDNPKETTNEKKGTVDSSESLLQDTVKLKETYNEEDNAVNEYSATRIKPIKANFKRINSILYLEWSSVLKKELEGTTENGEATFYYYNQNLEKIVTRQFGETFQLLTEYYLLKGQLSFVFEKSYKYNRPMYYDSTAMKENNDKEAFDIEKSKIIESRNYFENGKLLHQLNSQDHGSSMKEDYLLQEQKRIKIDFVKLTKLVATR